MLSSPILLQQRYRLEHELGSGGMGTVYRAFDRLTQTPVAIKRLNMTADFLAYLAESTGDHTLLSLAQEFETLASLRHPNIISVLDYGFDQDKSPYLVMEYLEHAAPLTEDVQGKSEQEMVRRLLDLLQALGYLHRRGVIHRDIKPDNALVVNGQVKVLDFGLAAAQGVAGELVGTLSYVAPEILQEQPASERSDLYAAGIIAYEMFSGQLPFSQKSLLRLTEAILNSPPDLSRLRTHNPYLREAIDRLLAKDPAQRFASASDAARAFAEAVDMPLAESAEVRESFLQAAQFVGRKAELSRLQSALRRATEGEGSLWLVGGESGVGKSRLLDEIRTYALVKGVPVIRGQAVAEGGLPYQVWRPVARRLLLGDDIRDEEAAVLKEILPDIEAFLERAVEDAPPLADQARRQRLELTLRDLLYRQPGTTLLLLEDLHWTNESLDLLASAAEQLSESHLLVIGTFRDDEAPDLPDRFPTAQLLTLNRLNEREIRDLSASMLGDGGTRSGVVNLLQRETEGNVYFLVEVVRTLAETAGSLEEIGEMTLPSGVFAGGMRQVVLRRLARVPEQHQPLLKLAAIAGRQLDLALMKRLPNEQPLAAWLQACSEAAVLEVKEDVWRFSHDKLRETLLANLAADERPDLYRQVAEVMEQQHGEEEGYQTQLFDLWQQAGDVQRMLAHIRAAVKEQNRLSNEPRTLAMVEATLEAGGDAIPTESRLWLEISRAQAIQHLSDFPRALELASGLLPQVRAAGLPQLEARCLGLMGICHDEMGNYDEALASLSSAQQLFQEQGEENEAAGIGINLANVYRKQGQVAPATESLEASLATFRRLGNRYETAAVLNNLGLIYRPQGDHARALDCFLTSHSIAQETGNRRGMFISLNNIAVSHAMQGSLEKARDAFQEVYERARSLDLRAQAIATVNLGVVHGDLGEFGTALEYLREGTAICRRINLTLHLVDALYNLAAMERIQGDPEQARRLAEEGLAIADERNMPYQRAMCQKILGTTLQDIGHYAGARQYYEEAIAQLTAIGVTPQLGGIYICLGKLAEDNDQPAEALDWYRQALSSAEQTNSQAGVIEIRAHLALLHLQQGDPAEAPTTLAACRPILKQVSSPAALLPLLMALFGLALVNKLAMSNAAHIWDTIRQHPALLPFQRRQHLPYLQRLVEQGPPLPAPATAIAPALDEMLEELLNMLAI